MPLLYALLANGVFSPFYKLKGYFKKEDIMRGRLKMTQNTLNVSCLALYKKYASLSQVESGRNTEEQEGSSL